MVFLAIAQVLLALSPLAEIRAGGSEAHVEAAGIAIHHSHNEANCGACAARVLLSSSELADRTAFFTATSADSPTAASTALHASSTATSLHSRAPPSNRV